MLWKRILQVGSRCCQRYARAKTCTLCACVVGVVHCPRSHWISLQPNLQRQLCGFLSNLRSLVATCLPADNQELRSQRICNFKRHDKCIRRPRGLSNVPERNMQCYAKFHKYSLLTEHARCPSSRHPWRKFRSHSRNLTHTLCPACRGCDFHNRSEMLDVVAFVRNRQCDFCVEIADFIFCARRSGVLISSHTSRAQCGRTWNDIFIRGSFLSADSFS